MPQYAGKFQYEGQGGPCQIAFETETCIVTPSSGQPIAFDLGDVDRATPGEWDISVTLYTGRTLQLRQFGAAFSRMQEEWLAALRNPVGPRPLSGDLQEGGR